MAGIGDIIFIAPHAIYGSNTYHLPKVETAVIDKAGPCDRIPQHCSRLYYKNLTIFCTKCVAILDLNIQIFANCLSIQQIA